MSRDVVSVSGFEFIVFVGLELDFLEFGFAVEFLFLNR